MIGVHCVTTAASTAASTVATSNVIRQNSSNVASLLPGSSSVDSLPMTPTPSSATSYPTLTIPLTPLAACPTLHNPTLHNPTLLNSTIHNPILHNTAPHSSAVHPQYRTSSTAGPPHFPSTTSSPEPLIDLADYQGHRVLALVPGEGPGLVGELPRYKRAVIDCVLRGRTLSVKFDDLRHAPLLLRQPLVAPPFDPAAPVSTNPPPPLINDFSPAGQQVTLGHLVAARDETAPTRNGYSTGRVIRRLDQLPAVYLIAWSSTPGAQTNDKAVQARAPSSSWVRRSHLRLLRAPWHEDLADAVSAARGASGDVTLSAARRASGDGTLSVAGRLSPIRPLGVASAASERACELEVARYTSSSTISPCTGSKHAPPPSPLAPPPSPLAPPTPAPSTPHHVDFPSSDQDRHASSSSTSKDSPLVSGGGAASLSRCVSAQSVDSLASSSASQSPSLLFLTRDGVTMAPGSTPKYKKGDVVCTPKG